MSIENVSPIMEIESLSRASGGSFHHLSAEEIEVHLRIRSYGGFQLPDAIRPSYDLQVIPSEGFRYEYFIESASDRMAPVLISSVSKERLVDLFLDLISTLKESVDVVLETTHSHSERLRVPKEYRRCEIDTPVLQSYLIAQEELLLADGFTSISVLDTASHLEVRLDEHKLLYMYGGKWSRFTKVLNDHGVFYAPDITFITDAEHVHISNRHFREQFERFRICLGIENDYHSA
ncbi:MAG: hypothetical protein Q4D38_13315 [Planctomycetia bacterium]|nr:hypothetical protein [Planctomycetia bacterium]